MTRSEPVLVGKRLVVRLATRRDAPAIVRFYQRNDAHLSRYESPKPRNFLERRFWAREAERRWEAWRRDRSCRLFLFDRRGKLAGKKDEVIGAAGLTSIVRGVFQAAFLGYSLDEGLQGQGLMHEALSLVVDYAFGELNLHRVMANFDPQNQRSGRVLKRLGFEVEGYAPRYLFINGAWIDHVLTARLNPAWKTPPGMLRWEPDGNVVEVPPAPGFERKKT